MALRPIDNALSIVPDGLRPKKQAKVSIQPQKKASEISVNDENKAPLPQPIDASSLNDARRFSLYHPGLLLPVLEKVMLVVVKSMKNPRSALCKTSIMAASDIFNAYGEKLLSTDSSAFDQLLLQLLLKASQDKKFVCEEADKSLTAMVNSIAALPLLQKLRGFVNHGNLRVRAKAAVSISNSVYKMGSEEIKEFGSVTLLQMASDLLNDRLPEAREAARSIVLSVYEAFTENEKLDTEEDWQSFCQSNLSMIQAQLMIKVVSSQ
uniref:CLASP N-terminal domain-containing protein n=1 Tax=Gossypium raimondii TaxID=29730 RepID=A0A0D2N8D0_GOSRA|nr:hypothetical protein B456_005G060500 [Gossypium raimondii]